MNWSQNYAFYWLSKVYRKFLAENVFCSFNFLKWKIRSVENYNNLKWNFDCFETNLSKLARNFKNEISASFPSYVSSVKIRDLNNHVLRSDVFISQFIRFFIFYFVRNIESMYLPHIYLKTRVTKEKIRMWCADLFRCIYRFHTQYK